MTIVLAGLAKNGQEAVIVTDTMATDEQGAISEMNKVYQFADSRVGIAGDYPHCIEVLQKCVQRGIPLDIDAKAGIIAEELAALRMRDFEKTQLSSLGMPDITANNYRQKLANSPHKLGYVDAYLRMHKIQTWFLLVGRKHDQYRLFSIGNPGVVTDISEVGYGSIGTGKHFADSVVCEYDKSMSLAKAKTLLIRAKSCSQCDMYVGAKTSIHATKKGEFCVEEEQKNRPIHK